MQHRDCNWHEFEYNSELMHDYFFLGQLVTYIYKKLRNEGSSFILIIISAIEGSLKYEDKLPF